MASGPQTRGGYPQFSRVILDVLEEVNVQNGIKRRFDGELMDRPLNNFKRVMCRRACAWFAEESCQGLIWFTADPPTVCVPSQQ